MRRMKNAMRKIKIYNHCKMRKRAATAFIAAVVVLIVVAANAVAIFVIQHNKPPRFADIDKDAIVAEPGIGIVGLCEIGMTKPRLEKIFDSISFEQRYKPILKKRKIDNSNTEEILDRFVIEHSSGFIPELGARLSLENEKIDWIRFRVQTAPQPPNETNQPAHFFRGKIKGGPMFSGQAVTKDEIISHFGIIEKTIGFFDPYHRQEPVIEVLDEYSREEVLYYPQSGIWFDVKSNTVESFTILQIPAH